MPPKVKGKRRPLPTPIGKPKSWVAKRKPAKELKPKLKRSFKLEEQPQVHHVGGNKFSMYVAEHKPHYQPRKKKFLTDRQVKRYRENQARAAAKLVEIGFEFNMLTGSWEKLPEFGV